MTKYTCTCCEECEFDGNCLTDARYPCPCCGEYEFSHFGSYDVCEICHWTDNAVQNTEPDYFGGPNWLTLNQARANWQKYRVVMTDKDKQERKEYNEKKYGKRTAPIE